MIPGKDEYYACPKCGNILSKGSLISGNTFGAKLYSDGKKIAPMLPVFPVISKCSKCSTIFWLEKELENQGFIDAEAARFLTISDYLTVLENKNYRTSKDEVFIRQQIWWLYNDRVRKGINLFLSKTDIRIWKSNVENLILKLDFEDLVDRIMIAELNRNLGNFQECKAILATISDPNIDWIQDAFEVEIAKNNTSVFRLI